MLMNDQTNESQIKSEDVMKPELNRDTVTF